MLDLNQKSSFILHMFHMNFKNCMSYLNCKSKLDHVRFLSKETNMEKLCAVYLINANIKKEFIRLLETPR